MMISIRKGDLCEQKADVLIVNAFSDAKEWGSAAQSVDEALGGMLSRAVKDDKYKPELGNTIVVRTEGRIPAKRVLLVGLGEKKSFEEESVRTATASAFNVIKAVGAKHVVSAFHGTGEGMLSPKLAGKAIVEGTRLADYTYGRYRKESAHKSPETFVIVTTDGKSVRSGEEGVKLGELFAAGTVYARDLVNTPGAHMAPRDLVDAARGIAKKRGSGVRVKVLDRAAMHRMGMGGILGISQGSDHEPYFVDMVYKPKKVTSKTKTIALVGKAVTFDSGGLSIKPAEAMFTMKLDMGGAAAVLGVFSVIGELQPDVIVHGIFGACENMPSGKAIRPGDVVEIMNGKTMEILHTDAEGRVTLADALSYAAKLKPHAIVDLATLTSACMVALGEEITGLMGNNRELVAKIESAAESAGEKVWELPLEPRYKFLIKSDVADYKNIAGRYGGAITAGLLLEEFVNGVPWVHLDIAGPSYADRPMGPYMKKAATGAGVRMMLEFLRSA